MQINLRCSCGATLDVVSSSPSYIAQEREAFNMRHYGCSEKVKVGHSMQVINVKDEGSNALLTIIFSILDKYIEIELYGSTAQLSLVGLIALTKGDAKLLWKGEK